MDPAIIVIICLVCLGIGVYFGIDLPRIKSNEKLMKFIKWFARTLVTVILVTIGACYVDTLGIPGIMALCFLSLFVGSRLSAGKPKKFRFPLVGGGNYVYVKHVEPDGSFVAEYLGKIRYFKISQEGITTGTYQVYLPHTDGWSNVPDRLERVGS